MCKGLTNACSVLFTTLWNVQVYLVELSKAFVGKLFCVAANICFKFVGGRLFGICAITAGRSHVCVCVRSEFRVCLFGVETRASFGPPVREQVPPDSDSSLSDSASEASTSDVNPIRAPVDVRVVGWWL